MAPRNNNQVLDESFQPLFDAIEDTIARESDALKHGLLAIERARETSLAAVNDAATLKRLRQKFDDEFSAFRQAAEKQIVMVRLDKNEIGRLAHDMAEVKVMLKDLAEATSKKRRFF